MNLLTVHEQFYIWSHNFSLAHTNRCMTIHNNHKVVTSELTWHLGWIGIWVRISNVHKTTSLISVVSTHHLPVDLVQNCIRDRTPASTRTVTTATSTTVPHISRCKQSSNTAIQTRITSNVSAILQPRYTKNADQDAAKSATVLMSRWACISSNRTAQFDLNAISLEFRSRAQWLLSNCEAETSENDIYGIWHKVSLLVNESNGNKNTKYQALNEMILQPTNYTQQPVKAFDFHVMLKNSKRILKSAETTSVGYRQPSTLIHGTLFQYAPVI
jgi:hypothetical protein